eukprot:GHVP01002731.1.p1 GENE.GHVP01002731.1~~GHVP01002731.1.p1  ORF type:complete len:239 (+),score=34.26 GHVP01002731.1:51-719(+)
MEFLKKFSDDLSNTTVGPPTFFQNDDQEAGGLNFRADPSVDSDSDSEELSPIGASASFGAPQQASVPSDTGARIVNAESSVVPLIKAFSLAATKQPGDPEGPLKPFDPVLTPQERLSGNRSVYEDSSDGCQFRAWKEGEDRCIRWCSHPGSHAMGCKPPATNILLHKKKFDDQKICRSDPDSPSLPCGLRKLTAEQADEDYRMDGITIKKFKIFEDILKYCP